MPAWLRGSGSAGASTTLPALAGKMAAVGHRRFSQPCEVYNPSDLEGIWRSVSPALASMQLAVLHVVDGSQPGRHHGQPRQHDRPGHGGCLLDGGGARLYRAVRPRAPLQSMSGA